MKNLPAFPTNINYPGDIPGLTKREYFAAMIMQGFAAQVAAQVISPERFYKEAAREAVLNADALLAELEKENK